MRIDYNVLARPITYRPAGLPGLLGRAIYAKAKADKHDGTLKADRRSESVINTNVGRCTVKGLAFSRSSGDLVKLDLHDANAFDDLCENFKPDVV